MDVVSGKYSKPFRDEPFTGSLLLFLALQSVDADHSGKITAIELQQALLNSNWSHFNAETCRLLIGMFDANQCVLHNIV